MSKITIPNGFYFLHPDGSSWISARFLRGRLVGTAYASARDAWAGIVPAETDIEVEPDHAALVREAGGDPDCDHDWTSSVAVEGGCAENPGVWSVGGTAMVFREHCRLCGLRRRKHYVSSHRSPGEIATVEYTQPDHWCAECQREECQREECQCEV